MAKIITFHPGIVLPIEYDTQTKQRVRHLSTF
jgi:hypothetical protein